MLTEGAGRWYTHRALFERAVRKFFENWTGNKTHYKKQRTSISLCKKRQLQAVTIKELIKWRVWSWLRINAGGVPNTCKSIDRSPACWTEIEANGWVIRKQPAHEDWDNPWKRGLRPDRYRDRMIFVLKVRDTGGWAYGALAGWWGNGPPWRWCIAGLRGWTATLGLRHGPDSYGRQQ